MFLFLGGISYDRSPLGSHQKDHEIGRWRENDQRRSADTLRQSCGIIYSRTNDSFVVTDGRKPSTNFTGTSVVGRIPCQALSLSSVTTWQRRFQKMSYSTFSSTLFHGKKRQKHTRKRTQSVRYSTSLLYHHRQALATPFNYRVSHPMNDPDGNRELCLLFQMGKLSNYPQISRRILSRWLWVDEQSLSLRNLYISLQSPQGTQQQYTIGPWNNSIGICYSMSDWIFQPVLFCIILFLYIYTHSIISFYVIWIFAYICIKI